MSKEIFSRYEVKYLIPFDKYQRLVEAMMPYMRFDKFGNEGRYNIVSLYFDSPDYKIYYETRNKLRFRQKLRLRVYDNVTVNDTSFLEVKQKFNNVVNKRRTSIKLNDAYKYIYEGEKENLQASNFQTLREIDNFKTLYNLQPEVVVSYDRQAFHGLFEDDLRVTFDYNLMCRSDDLRIENGPQGTNFVDPNLVILEVKVNNSVPLWLARMLSEFECSRQSVSKFCTSIDLMTGEEEKKAVSQF
ncbi:polyphosphate polymerase domain-containing protein [Thalassorhabdus alkalitolerans]|uniref:Polyphosphate polymerase domain-containing protein n=1 Tax=Thalassorhabdus alkalitolerans TaxID=2282697 RepID=A0ABW0YJ63_9BACI